MKPALASPQRRTKPADLLRCLHCGKRFDAVGEKRRHENFFCVRMKAQVRAGVCTHIATDVEASSHCIYFTLQLSMLDLRFEFWRCG